MPGFSIGRLDRSRIRSVLMVLSGKGGVGKTFVSALLATEFHRNGARVGVLDADITGPSIARVFGTNQVPRLTKDGSRIEPLTSSEGVFVMSMASVTAATQIPLIWRGPMINSAIRGLFKDTDWPELDYLIVDLPPGTSDAPMTVFQSLDPDGVVLVTAPTELAAEVVAKASAMAKTFSAPILGLIENMAYFTCPHGERVELFGPSRGPEFATRMGIPYLGSLPIFPGLPALADAGRIEELRSPRHIWWRGASDCSSTASGKHATRPRRGPRPCPRGVEPRDGLARYGAPRHQGPASGRGPVRGGGAGVGTTGRRPRGRGDPQPIVL